MVKASFLRSFCFVIPSGRFAPSFLVSGRWFILQKTNYISMKISLLSLTLVLCLVSRSFALPDEGMWLPLFVKRLNHEDMKKKGLKLSAEEIYDINNSSLKDAIVWFNGGCTAEFVSGEGLILTNHHCAYDIIQSNSTLEKNYLKDGFWAKDRASEIPAKGVTATMLVRIEDLTQKVTSQLKDEMSETERNQKIREILSQIEKQAVEGTHYNATAKSFFDGNEFYLFVYETFKDVRLVGAPSESIGKFGGDTDNWMWPRHTGDFSMLRIYSGKDNKPADQNPENVPFKPKKHLKISLDGVAKNDFAMIMGYPGSTDRFLTSHGVKLLIENTNPTRIAIRDAKLNMWKADMDADPAIRLQYASKYASIANYWKYFIGEIRGINRLDVLNRKIAEEKALQDWIAQKPERSQKYGEIFTLLEEGYKELQITNKAYYYYVEAGFLGAEVIRMALQCNRLLSVQDPTAKATLIEELKASAEEMYKDFNLSTDRKVFAGLMKMYYSNVDPEYHPSFFEEIRGQYNIDFNRYAEFVYAKSIFSSGSSLMAFLQNPDLDLLKEDPIFKSALSLQSSVISKMSPSRQAASTKIARGNRLFVAAMREMNPGKKYAPNANSTMRFTYGQVLDYFPQDAAYYNYYTTHKGILEKEDPKNPEFVVEPKLKEALLKKDFGRYGTEGQLVVAFLTNNDITGGNSGSPVLNANGELIGIAFDGNWEAMSSKVAFEPNLQRTICVDIRYVLWVVDKLNGAGHLINEMSITPQNKKGKSLKHSVKMGE
jgi:hypothetical protein